MKRILTLIIVLGLAAAAGGCEQGECDCPEVPLPVPVPTDEAAPPPHTPAPASVPDEAAPAPAPEATPAPLVPASDEIGWDFAQRLLKPLGRELGYIKLAVQPERLATIRASDFHAFSLADSGVLAYVFEFPTPESAMAKAGLAAPALKLWGLLDPWDAAIRHNLVLVSGILPEEGIDDGRRYLSGRAADVFGARVEVDRKELEAATALPEVEAGLDVAEDPISAQRFFHDLEAELLTLWIGQERAHWVNATNITHDTEILAAQAAERVMEFMTRKAQEARAFTALTDPASLSEEHKRKLHLLRIANPLPAPSNPEGRAELARIAASMSAQYGKGKYCPPSTDGSEATCLTLGEMYDIMAKSRDPEKLQDIWVGWRQIAVPMRDEYARYVELANEGAQKMRFPNLGDLWKSGYDMPPADFQAETERLWKQMEPFYKDLHCYVRGRLVEVYGDRIPPAGPIPAHLLGNMWAQDWTNIFEHVIPEPDKTPYDLTTVLEEKGYDPKKMVETAEAFFVSLGLAPLPQTFWERSMFSKPRDREVVCHASAWDIDWKDDLRIKMCIRINEEDFTTIHHELGHNYYQRAYRDQPTLFMNSANDGFHEALGDVLSLSVTPTYLKKIGLMPEDAEASDLNMLMRKALEKIAFLPFGLLIDRWRWEVFAGKVPPEQYNEAWWQMRLEYQGIAPPVERPADAFDPGAKYHIPANVPYTRYFLAAILQFQFHRELCKLSGHEGPLHACSIYGSEAAGKSLDEMMQLGLSKPWPEALEKITGGTEMDASAIVEYFEPLSAWLKEENQKRNYTCGW